MTRIVNLWRGFDKWEWLCDEHVSAAEGEGWEVKKTIDPGYMLPCQECELMEYRAKQAAKGESP